MLRIIIRITHNLKLLVAITEIIVYVIIIPKIQFLLYLYEQIARIVHANYKEQLFTEINISIDKTRRKLNV